MCDSKIGSLEATFRVQRLNTVGVAADVPGFPLITRVGHFLLGYGSAGRNRYVVCRVEPTGSVTE